MPDRRMPVGDVGWDDRGMGGLRSDPKLVTVLGRAFRCLVCDHGLFWSRQVKLSTTSASSFDLVWGNRSATGLICARCGYVHEFAGRERPALWNAKVGYPEGAES